MKEFEAVKDSGERRQFETGAVRDIALHKGRFDLIPPIVLERLAKHFENGAVKYGDNNYRKGIPTTSFIDSCLRHINEVRMNYTDEDHLAAAIWNLVALMETEYLVELGQLPKSLLTHWFYNPNNINNVDEESFLLNKFLCLQYMLQDTEKLSSKEICDYIDKNFKQNINFTDKNNWTILNMISVKTFPNLQDKIDIIFYLLDTYADQIDVNIPEVEKLQTPFMNLCSDWPGDIEKKDKYRCLLKKFIDFPSTNINAVNRDNFSTLMIATWHNNLIAVEELLQTPKLAVFYNFTPFASEKSYNVIDVAHYRCVEKEILDLLKNFFRI